MASLLAARTTAPGALLALLFGCASPDRSPAPASPAPALPTAGSAATPDAAAVARAVAERKPLMPRGLVTRSLEARSAEQKAQASEFRVRHDFRFVDRSRESGISFEARAVDDAGRDFKAVHYDHFCGLSVADVDGDGRLDIYFLTQLGRNQLWKNLGGGRFRDVTEAAGLARVDPISVAAAFGDYDNDGDPDLFETSVRHGNRLYRNDGKGRFEDVSQVAGVGYSGHSSGALFFDYDRDGRLDLFVSNVGVYTSVFQGRGGYYVGLKDGFKGHLDPTRREDGILYRNIDGSRFENVNAAVGLGDTGWNGDPVLVDLNEDGWPDLYLANMQGDDHYLENRGGKRFVDRTAELFPKTSWGAMGARFFDWDNDQLLDLYVTDMHSDMWFPIGLDDEHKKSDVPARASFLGDGSNNIFGNSFWSNRGGGRFEEISDRVGAENYWPWGFSTGDLNADGWEDVFVTASMGYPWPPHYNVLLLNDRGRRFRAAEFLTAAEPRPEAERMAPWFELDCSGSDSDHAECAGKSGAVAVMGSVGTRSSAIFDVEGDGDLDIVTLELPGRPRVLLSDLGERATARWIAFRPMGRASNRDGIGVRVVVTVGGRRLVKVHDTSSGFLSHSLLPLWFGLGEAARADRVEVLWPSGRMQVVTEGLESGRVVTLEEPAS